MTLVWMVAFAWGAELTLSDVLTSTREHHPLVDAARARELGASAEALVARGAFDPVARAKLSGTQDGSYAWLAMEGRVDAPTALWGSSVGAGWRVGTGAFATYDGALETPDGGEVFVGVDVPLLRDGWTDRRRTALARGDLEVDVAGAEVDQRALELMRLAGWRYWEWVAAGQRVRFAATLLTLAQERDRQLALQVAAGAVPDIVRVDNQRLVLERLDRQVQARRAFELASIDLSLYLRDASGERHTPTLDEAPALPEPAAAALPPPDVAAETALRMRPELARLAAQREQIVRDRRLAENQLLPGLWLEGDLYQPVAGGEPSGKAGVSLDLAVPVRAARGRLRAADAAAARNQAESTFARQRIEADLADAQSALRAAGERVGYARSLVDVASRVEEAERRRFELGDGNLIFVNQREVATFEARMIEADALAAWQRAAIDLAYATGTLGAPGSEQAADQR